jgi:hypothetical protein
VTKKELLALLEPFPPEARITLKIDDAEYPLNTSFSFGHVRGVRPIDGKTPLVQIYGDNRD